MHSLSMSKVRKIFFDLPEAVKNKPLFVTRHGRPVLVILASSQFEGMVETLKILGDHDLTRRLMLSLKQASTGRTVSMNQALTRLGF